ncbi:UNVERIFIED_CONTAM: hypothetical protein FKN15_066540 [Acipenser sinensis]
MGKPQKKKNLSDKVRKTKTAADIKNNPFEVKINRQKFEILGRKSKHDIGLPGVSRSKAIKKRKETLLKEYKLKDKTNKFIDKRFGEYDTKMAPEDKILKRFALERQCPVTTLQDVATGLMLCCLLVEYISLSHRFVPELINFLLGILHLAVPEKQCLGYTVVPPFKTVGKSCNLLVVKDEKVSESWMKKCLPMSAIQRLELKDELEKDHFSVPIGIHIFTYIDTWLELRQEILQAIEDKTTSHVPLVFEKKKPVPLKLYTPKIMEILDYGKRRGGTKEERERQRLIHKHKKEFKGAIREIRKDSQFLAREKLSEIMTRDAERKRKVKELFGSLATQEGEWKALKKMKMKR